MSQFAYSIRPDGSYQSIEFDNVKDVEADGSFLWLNIDPQDEKNRNMVFEYFPVDSSLKDILVSNSQRPRMEVFEDHIFLSLRGVNLTEKNDPDDMVNLRIIISQNEIVTLHTRDMKSIEATQAALGKKKKFTSPAALLVRIITALNERLSYEIEELADRITNMEEVALSDDIQRQQEPLSEIRRTLIGFQKYLLPQASVMQSLWDVNCKWIKKRERTHLKNQAEKTSTLVGELEHLRQSAAVLQEEIKSSLSEHMNRSMYRLTIVATIMLPLGLFAGLMGSNVGGMPLTNSPYGFWIICSMSVGLGLLVFGFLKWLKWI